MMFMQFQMVVTVRKQLYSKASNGNSSIGGTDVDLAAYLVDEEYRKVMEALGKELFPVEGLWQRNG